MNLHRAKMLIILLAAIGLLLFALAACFKTDWLFMSAAASYLLLMLVWALFNRCPHCRRHLGRDTGIYCPHCGKKLYLD